MDRTRSAIAPDILTLVGENAISLAAWPCHSMVLSIRLSNATFAVDIDSVDARAAVEADLVIVIGADACRRTFGSIPAGSAVWHLTGTMRAIASSIRNCELAERPGRAFRLAKSIEFLCAVFTEIGKGGLVPVDQSTNLSEMDARRIVAARRLIDERWHEKLTLDCIARACSLNRAKLTRGFRLMFDCSVAEALSEHRLGRARHMLLVTNLPVSSIGYTCGYLNNASFTRAFSRRFGMAPTQLRRAELAA